MEKYHPKSKPKDEKLPGAQIFFEISSFSGDD
jgi:hypothetical protein